MQSVLPPDDEYTYVIQSHVVQKSKQFDGAPDFAFSALVRNPEEVNTWLKKMMESSYCTYRVSRGGHKSAGKCILCKHEMHCQHFRKPLTTIQLQRAAVAKAKKGKKPVCIQVREKKTKCPSHLTISLQVPTKKQKLSAEKHPYLLSHRAVLNINFIHNHPIHASSHSCSTYAKLPST